MGGQPPELICSEELAERMAATYESSGFSPEWQGHPSGVSFPWRQLAEALLALGAVPYVWPGVPGVPPLVGAVGMALARSKERQLSLLPGLPDETPRGTTAGEARNLQKENTALLLECERRQSAAIQARREVLELQRRLQGETRAKEQLDLQRERLMDHVSELIKANRALQSALISDHEGKLCMHECNEGVVLECADDEIAVRYGVGENSLEQVYHKSQFVGRQLPRPGDRIEAHVFAWCRPHKPRGVKHYLTEEDIENARRAQERGVTGPVES